MTLRISKQYQCKSRGMAVGPANSYKIVLEYKLLEKLGKQSKVNLLLNLDKCWEREKNHYANPKGK